MFRIIITGLFFLASLNTFANTSGQQWKRTQLSDAKHFETTLICRSPPEVGSFQRCQLKITNLVIESDTQQPTQISRVVKNAQVSIEGGMPAHHHGLPSSPIVSWSESDNAYLIKGLKFSMPGEWFLRFYINDLNNSDKKVVKESSMVTRDKVSFKFSI